jgi:hypothetical protein
MEHISKCKVLQRSAKGHIPLTNIKIKTCQRLVNAPMLKIGYFCVIYGKQKKPKTFVYRLLLHFALCLSGETGEVFPKLQRCMSNSYKSKYRVDTFWTPFLRTQNTHLFHRKLQ